LTVIGKPERDPLHALGFGREDAGPADIAATVALLQRALDESPPRKARPNVPGVVRTGGCPVTDAFARELERQLGSLLHGGLAPYDFRRWFASALWAAEGVADDTLAFAYEVENIIAERSGDQITDDEMMKALRAVAVARYGRLPVATTV